HTSGSSGVGQPGSGSSSTSIVTKSSSPSSSRPMPLATATDVATGSAGHHTPGKGPGRGRTVQQVTAQGSSQGRDRSALPRNGNRRGSTPKPKLLSSETNTALAKVLPQTSGTTKQAVQDALSGKPLSASERTALVNLIKDLATKD